MAQFRQAALVFPTEPGVDLATRVNSQEVWGITKGGELALLRDWTPRYYTLEDVFYGLHNIAVPGEMAGLMNPDEILALLCAVPGAKRDKASFSRLKGKALTEIVAELNRKAYARPEILAVRDLSRRDGRLVFSDSPGSERSRLSLLPEDVSKAFLDSFREDYRPSKRESGAYGQFYDPNIGGDSRSVMWNATWRRLLRDYEGSMGTARH